MQSLEMLRLPQTSLPHLGCLLPEPFGAQGHTGDTHTLRSVFLGAHSALKAGMRDIAILDSTHLSVGLENIYINDDSI